VSTPVVITIDGPAASGKTSVSRDLANLFGWQWVSTGSFYRGLAVVAVREGVDLGNPQGLASLAKSDVWSVQMNKLETTVFHKDKRINDEIAKEEMGMHASRISQYPEVRAALLPLQRACANSNKVLVAEGRDCGTVVFPKAEVKFYLTASSESRAFRRSLEQEDTNFDSLIDLQKKRDEQDKKRAVAPMQIPPGAIVVDSSSLEREQVVAKVVGEVRKQLQAQGLEKWL
jgi:CMP/dCMP kinase